MGGDNLDEAASIGHSPPLSRRVRNVLLKNSDYIFRDIPAVNEDERDARKHLKRGRIPIYQPWRDLRLLELLVLKMALLRVRLNSVFMHVLRP